ncbi:hypothetical protein [Pantoea sp. Fr+CA_20]|uniref:hypothetical protein n=1 Tax=Pantoea sp. Fr+CA_20 TaxID=2929506 RepID=UPI00211833D6|nr:hypothetical protein [Pantoea sp. Fr+CA_20]
MKNRRIISGVVAVLLLSCATATPAAEVSTESVNPQNLGLTAASYGVFSYKNNDALIKSVNIIQQLGYQTDTPAEGLSLDSYREGVVIFTPEAGGKRLLAGNALGALGYHMQPQNLTNEDALVIKNTPIGANALGKVVNQSYEIIYNGQRSQASRPIVIPPKGLAVTFVKLGEGKLLVMTTSTD